MGAHVDFMENYQIRFLLKYKLVKLEQSVFYQNNLGGSNPFFIKIIWVGAHVDFMEDYRIRFLLK